MNDESDEDYVTVSVSVMLEVTRSVRMERKEAERIAALRGFDLRMAVDEAVVFNCGDCATLEDVVGFTIEGEENYSEEE